MSTPNKVIPLVDLKRQYFSIKKEINEAIERVLSSGLFIMGDNVKAFEREFAKYLGVKYGIGVASGTDALTLALKALGVRSGDEVVTVSFTFVSTVNCIVHNGARPVFVDVDPETCTLDVSQLKHAITQKTKAIIPVHLYGHPVEMDPLLEIADQHGVYVVEDAAQAHGAEYKGRKVGSLGHVACFSFYPSKNLGAYGDGGMIVTNNGELAEKLRMLREYGRRGKYVHELPGFNSRLDELQAAILRVKLRHLDEWNKQRRRNAEIYNQLFSEMRLDNVITLPTEKSYAKHVYHLYVIRTKERNELGKRLISKGIATGIHYPIPVHKQKAYHRFKHSDLPVTEMLAESVLSLPMFPELTESEIQFVCSNIKTFFLKKIK